MEVPQFQTNPYAFEVGDLHFRFLKDTLAMDTWMHSANPKWFTTHWSNWGYSVYILQRQLESVHPRPRKSERPCVPSSPRTQAGPSEVDAVEEQWGYITICWLPRLGPFYWSASNRTNQVASWTLAWSILNQTGWDSEMWPQAAQSAGPGPRKREEPHRPQQLPWTQ